MSNHKQVRRSGQGLTEYLLLASLIAVGAIWFVREYSDTLKVIFVGHDVQVVQALGLPEHERGLASQ